MSKKIKKRNKETALSQIREARSTNASSLDLSSCGLEELPDELYSLKNIQELDLQGNRLNKLSDKLSELIDLRRLTLWGNPLKNIPDFIFSFKNLDALHLGDMHLGEVPKEIARLSKLRSLWVWENDLTELPEEMASLRELQFIAMGRNLLSDLPSWFGSLPITSISAFSNKFKSIPQAIFQLRKLTHLDLNDNEISSVSPLIANLNELVELTLSGNPLESLPDDICQMPKLLFLDLDRTLLSSVPVKIGAISTLEYISLSDCNKLKFPPREIVAIDTGPGEMDRSARLHWRGRERAKEGESHTISATLQYLRECASSHERVWESKLLIVGEGQVGKTWLFEALRGRLSGGGHPPDTGTVGIEIGELKLPLPTGGQQMKLSCWDFAGQSINHATHQFFFSSRALFLLVWSARAGWEAGKLRKWLTNIRDRAPGAKIILIATQIDQPHSDYPEKDLLAEFPQIAHAIQVSSATGFNIERLRVLIAQEASLLPMMGQIWPSRWRAAFFDIKRRQEKGAYSSAHDVFGMLEKSGIDRRGGPILVQWLNELGDILYFPDHPSLSDLIVLDPQWVTRRVGEILADIEVKNCHGVLTQPCVNRLWSDLPHYVRGYLLEMMDFFDLAYRIQDDPSNRSIVVERLPENAPDYEPLWASFANQPELRLRFKLGSMHPGIPTWFIARCHRFSLNLHWVRGVMFGDACPDPRHLALVVANTTERRVDFAVRGPFPWGFLPLLVDGFIDTIGKRYPGLAMERWVPCPGKRKDLAPCDNEVALSDLENLRFPKEKSDSPIEVWQCPRCRKSHRIDQLLLGLTSPPLDAAITLDDVFKAIVETKTAVAQEVSRMLVEQRKWIQLELVREWNTAQQIEEMSCPTAFSLWPIKGKTLIHTDEFYLQLYCMNPDCWHSIGSDGGCSFRAKKPELRKAINAMRTCARWLRPLANLLPAAGAVAGENIGALADWAKEAKNEMDLTAKVIAELEKVPAPEADIGGVRTGSAKERKEADLQALKSFLQRLPFKVKPYGGLRRVRTPEGHILWLCSEHSKRFIATG